MAILLNLVKSYIKHYEQESVPFHCIVKHLSVLLIRPIVFWCCVMGVLCLQSMQINPTLT